MIFRVKFVFVGEATNRIIFFPRSSHVVHECMTPFSLPSFSETFRLGIDTAQLGKVAKRQKKRRRKKKSRIHDGNVIHRLTANHVSRKHLTWDCARYDVTIRRCFPGSITHAIHVASRALALSSRKESYWRMFLLLRFDKRLHCFSLSLSKGIVLFFFVTKSLYHTTWQINHVFFMCLFLCHTP